MRGILPKRKELKGKRANLEVHVYGFKAGIYPVLA
jgi:hypothetical protein